MFVVLDLRELFSYTLSYLSASCHGKDSVGPDGFPCCRTTCYRAICADCQHRIETSELVTVVLFF